MKRILTFVLALALPFMPLALGVYLVNGSVNSNAQFVELALENGGEPQLVAGLKLEDTLYASVDGLRMSYPDNAYVSVENPDAIWYRGMAYLPADEAEATLPCRFVENPSLDYRAAYRIN